MKQITLFILMAMFAVSCSQTKSENTEKKETPVEKQEAVVKQINVADFEKEAPALVGKEIEIKGIVDHVCKHGGKKLLLVGDGAKIHAVSDERIDEDLVGNEVILKGIVEEKIIDEATCLKMEENMMNKHKEGEAKEDELEARKKQIAFFRDSMKAAGTDHLAFYSVKYISAEPVVMEK